MHYYATTGHQLGSAMDKKPASSNITILSTSVGAISKPSTAGGKRLMRGSRQGPRLG